MASFFRISSHCTPPPAPQKPISTRRTLSQHPLSTPRQERLPYEPNPSDFIIKKVVQYRKKVGDGNYLLVLINYPNCENFEGNKVLVFENLREIELRGMKTIDPHFFNDGRYKTPIARFEPSNKGVRLAKDFCKMAADTT